MYEEVRHEPNHQMSKENPAVGQNKTKRETNTLFDKNRDRNMPRVSAGTTYQKTRARSWTL